MDVAREDVEQVIAKELRSHHQQAGAWARAMAECQGEFSAARKRYRELRLAELCAAREGDGPRLLRTEMRHELERQDRATAYSVLGVLPDAGDGEIAAAISRLIVRGDPLDAERRYAVEVLGDDSRRADYDRELLRQLRAAKSTRRVAPSVDPRAVPRTAADIHRSSRDFWLALGAVAVIGLYFGIEHHREMHRLEIGREAATRQARLESLHRAANRPAADSPSVIPRVAQPGARAAN